MAGIYFLLGGSNKGVEQVVSLDPEAFASRHLYISALAVFFRDVITKFGSASGSKRHHLVGKMMVVSGLLLVSLAANGFNHVVLGIALAGVNHVVDGIHAAEMR